MVADYPILGRFYRTPWLLRGHVVRAARRAKKKKHGVLALCLVPFGPHLVYLGSKGFPAV